MANVWKIGSRWSDIGTWDSRIITIFRRSGVVFVGGKYAEKFHNEVSFGDYFAIADGRTVAAVAKATSEVMPLTEMIAKKLIKVKDTEPFDINWDFDGCYGIRVKIVDLPLNEQFQYWRSGSFYSANQYWNEIIDLYESKVEKSFDISAKTYRLCPTCNNKDSEGFRKESLLDGKTKYIIPVYQREYSWGYDQTSRFIRDIFRGFWGTENKKKILAEPMFIGTMQLSFKKFISTNEYEQDIIDGQQRLSTFLCLIKYLQMTYPNNMLIQNLPNDWLETRVNNGKEDALLNEMLAMTKMDDDSYRIKRSYNRYIDNLYVIEETINELLLDVEGEEKVSPFFFANIDSFVSYLQNNVFFVVIETVAGLSKTIQIFNTINTTGLDLGGDDLFKVRLYEYLRDKKGAEEETFNTIGEVYKRVKVLNEKWRNNHNFDVININLIRTVYKNYLIAKYGLNNQLFQMATDTFYDYLFDVLLNVQEHKEIKYLNGLEMSIEDLNMVIDACYLWNSCEYKNANQMITGILIEKSRYSRYTTFAYQLMIAKKDLEIDKRLNLVMDYYQILSRIFFCYSLKYLKQVNEIHSLMEHAFKLIIQKPEVETKILLLQKLESVSREELANNIGWTIAYNRTCKDLVCCLSAYFDELESSLPLDEFEAKLSWGYDIEHIHANADEKVEMEEELQNSIGNLMLLEYDINRSIGAESFYDKVHGVSGRFSYQDSNYATVKKIATYSQWNTEEAIQRKEDETKKILNFILDKVDYSVLY